MTTVTKVEPSKSETPPGDREAGAGEAAKHEESRARVNKKSPEKVVRTPSRYTGECGATKGRRPYRCATGAPH